MVTYDILLYGLANGGYEVLELNRSNIVHDQMQIGEILSDSEVDDLLQMGFKIKYKEFQ